MVRVWVASLTLGCVAASPMWGCGLMGPLPGISSDGIATRDMQVMIDGLMASSSVGKTHYWNWDLAPDMQNGTMQYLTKDFIFMPQSWGAGVVDETKVRTAGQTGFLDTNGNPSPAEMGPILLGTNEPDMYGSCMGGMMGTCVAPCSMNENGTNAYDCPVCDLYAAPGSQLPNSLGECNCWESSNPTGAGFWSVSSTNCAGIRQPLPNLWTDYPACGDDVISMWRQTAAIAARKGYTYLSTPLAAVSMDYLRTFVEKACTGCSDMSCGCPTHVGWHFYAQDCRPEATGGYDHFQAKLNATASIMEAFPNIQGAIVNEVGMLNCAMDTPSSPCVPNGPTQVYPAEDQPNHTCPSTAELPNGLGSFIEHLLEMVVATTTSDGRQVVKSISWFNENEKGGTYNLRLFDDDGSVNEMGQAYISACQKWASAARGIVV